MNIIICVVGTLSTYIYTLLLLYDSNHEVAYKVSRPSSRPVYYADHTCVYNMYARRLDHRAG